MDTGQRPPLLVLLKGHPCCGKSTFGKKLANRLGCALIDKDDAKSVLCDALQSLVEEASLNEVSYKITLRVVQTQLEAGLDCVVDTPLARKSLFEQFAHICRKVALIECVARDEAIWRARVEERAARLAGTPDQHKAFSWTDLQSLIQKYEECWRWSDDVTSLDLLYHTVIDTTSVDPELHKTIQRELYKAIAQ